MTPAAAKTKVMHRLSPGWVIVLVGIAVVIGLAILQVHHNGNTINSLKRQNAALTAEAARARDAECTLLRGRRAIEESLSSWLGIEAQAESGVGDGHRAEALALQQTVDQQLATEALPGCPVK